MNQPGLVIIEGIITIYNNENISPLCTQDLLSWSFQI